MSRRPTLHLSAAVAGAGATLALGTALGAPAATASPASPDAAGGVSNPYSPAYGHSYRHGAVPTRELNTQMHRWEAQTKGARPTSSKMLSYGGGVDGIGVTSGGAPKVYLVFYGSPAWHVGIFTGGDMMIDSPRTGKSTSERNMFGTPTGFGRF